MKDWRSLLVSPNAVAVPVRRFDVLQKGGRPFLFLPKAPGPAEKTLELYPAQRFKARAFVAAVKWVIRCRLPVPGPNLDMPMDPRTRFATFLRKTAQVGEEMPLFGVLEGYLRNPRLRYILLLFDRNQQPHSVIKVGLNAEARKLVLQERKFFMPTAPALPGVPEPLGHYADDDADAIAYPYYKGRTATYEDRRHLGAVLSPWIAEGPMVPAEELVKWTEVQALQNDAPQLKVLFNAVARTPVRPVLSHGDFAAWNVRISPRGEWQILDWERASRVHFPAWDWFNFIVQHHIHVFRSTPATTVAALEELWADPEFCAYAERTGIRDILKEYAITYLLYMWRHFGLIENIDLANSLQRVAVEIQRRHFPAHPFPNAPA